MSKIYLQIGWFFYFLNSGSLCLQKFFRSLLKCPSKGKQKKERSGCFLELFKEFTTKQNLPWLLQKWEHFNLQWRQWMHFVFFNFLSGPLSLLYMQVPSSKHIERTLLVGCWLRLQHLGGYLLAGLNFPVGEGRTSSLEGDLGSLVPVNLDQWADWRWEATVDYCLSLTHDIAIDSSSSCSALFCKKDESIFCTVCIWHCHTPPMSHYLKDDPVALFF